MKRSSLYRTAPQIDVEQEFFWNAVIAGDWGGSPESLLERLLMIESRLGRERDSRRPKGPRVIDLDLLLIGGETRQTSRLTLPHPGLTSRRFALEPLLEVAPHLVHPWNGRPWQHLLLLLSPQGVDRTDLTW